jgi:hypothetical protein
LTISLPSFLSGFFSEFFFAGIAWLIPVSVYNACQSDGRIGMNNLLQQAIIKMSLIPNLKQSAGETE